MADSDTTNASKDYTPNFKGWICPSCGCGVAPWMSYCPRCSPKYTPPPYDPWQPYYTTTTWR